MRTCDVIDSVGRAWKVPRMLRHLLSFGWGTALFATACACAMACSSTAPVAAVDAAPPPAEADASEAGSAAPRPPASPPPPSCFGRGRAVCNPAIGDGCSSSERCDFSETDAELTLACAPVVPGFSEIGARCTVSGPACARGSRCTEGVCRKFCCAGSDCTAAGESCLPFDDRLGTLGVCGVKPECAKAGESCKRPSDCCSSDCHSGHCH